MISLLSLLDEARPLPEPVDAAALPECDRLIAVALARHWLPEPEIPLEDWLRQNIKITGNQSAGDRDMPLDLRRNPQARIVCDFLKSPGAAELNIEKSSAGGISTTIIAACVERLKNNPCNILYLIGNVSEARKMSDVYWRPFLRQVFGTEIADSRHQATLHFKINGVEVFLGSPTEDMLRGKQFGIVVEDESDTMEDVLKGGANDLDTAQRERTKNFKGAKILRLCCPLYKFDPKLPADTVQSFCRINRHFQRGDQREFRVPCPACRMEHPVRIEHLDYTHAKDLAGAWDLDAIRTGTVWRCPSCRHTVRDTLAEKTPFLESGRHYPTTKPISSRVWSAKITDLAVLFGQAASWGFVTSSLVEAENSGASAVAAVRRSHLAEPREREAENQSRTIEALMKHCSHYDRGICPVIPWVVAMAADVQKDASYFPWGIGAFNQRGDMFLIDWGEAQDTDELETIRARPIPVNVSPAVLAACLLPDGKPRFPEGVVPPVYVTHGVIDSGHRAKGEQVDPTLMTVYNFCAKAGYIREIRGGQTCYRLKWVPVKGRGDNQIESDRLLKTSKAQLSDSVALPLLLYNDPAFKSEMYHIQLAYDPTPGAPETDTQAKARALPRILFPRYTPDATLADGQIGWAQFLAEMQAERYGTIMQSPRNGGPKVEVRKWYSPTANNFGDVVKMLKILHADLPKP